MPEISLPPSAPLLRWFWPDAARPAEVSRAVAHVRACGYGGLVLWPESRWNFDDERFRQNALAVAQACRDADLELWLRDDWTSPSGTGLLNSRELREEYGATALRFTEENVPRGAAWQCPPGVPLAAWAAPTGGRAPRFAEALDLLPAWLENPARLVASFGEDALVLTFWSEPWPGDIDRLHPGSARLILESVHENWRALLGEFFGNTLRGFWTLGPPLPQNAPDVFPWTPRLPAEFFEAHGYDLLANLAALIAPTGDDAAGVRQDFWQTLAQLLERNWWRPQRDWCERHGVELTVFAQPGGEENFKNAVAAHADPATTLRGGHHIAVDAQGTLLWSRLAASVAALNAHGGGRPGAHAVGGCLQSAQPTLDLALRANAGTEACPHQSAPIAVWHDSTPQTRAPQLLKLWQHGVGGRLDARGAEHEPFSTAGTQQAESSAAALLAATRPGARVGVLLATRSAWAHYHPKGHRFLRLVWDDFLGAARLLDELHYDFLLLPEDDFLASKTVGDQLLCGAAELPLDMIVLPGATALHRDTWNKLESFVESGGKVVCLGLLPRWSERGRDVELEAAIEKSTLLTIADLYGTPGAISEWEESSSGYPITKENERGGRLSCYQPSSNTDRADAKLRVRQMLKDSLPPGCETQSPHLRFARRTTGDGDVFLLSNEGGSQRVMVRLRARRDGEGTLREWRTALGAAQEFPVWSRFSSDEGGGFGVEISCAANEMRWLEFQPGAGGAHLEKASFAVDEFDGHTARGHATHQHLPRVTVRRGARFAPFDARETATIPPPLMLDEDWQVTRRGANILRLKNWQRPAAEFGASFTVQCSFRAEHLPSPLFVFAPPEIETLFLNGGQLTPQTPPFAGESPFTALRGNWFLAPRILAGDNELDCAWSGDGAPEILLAGDFDFNDFGEACEPRALMLGIGSWHEQGLPFYCGALDYAQEFSAPEAWENCRVWLELSSLREAVAVKINGADCSALAAPPWRFEISAALRPGEKNSLCLTVANTLAPLLGADTPPPAGLLGPVRLVAYPVVEIITEKTP